MDFKVGDKVEIKKAGKIGTIIEIRDVLFFSVTVKINNRERYFNPEELRRI